MITRRPFRELIVYILLFVMSVYALAAFYRVVTNVLVNSQDYYSYWIDGIDVREGQNSYLVAADNLPQGAVQFIGGIHTMPATPLGTYGAANTAPLVLLLTPLSYFWFTTARILWMLLNITLALVTPWLVIHLLFGAQPAPLLKALIVLIFYCMLPVRNGIGNGQVTTLTFFLMLVALAVYEDHKLVAGIALGFAMGRFSMAVPVFLWMIYKRQWTVLGLVLLVQIAGTALFAIITHSSPLQIVVDQIQTLVLARLSADKEGISLASIMPSNAVWKLLSFVVLTIPILFVARRAFARSTQAEALGTLKTRAEDVWLVGILMLWVTLSVYHSYYDAIVAIVCMGLLISWTVDQNLRTENRLHLTLLVLFLTFTIVLFLVPGTVLTSVLSPSVLTVYLQVITASSTIVLVIIYFLAISIYLRQTRALNAFADYRYARLPRTGTV